MRALLISRFSDKERGVSEKSNMGVVELNTGLGLRSWQRSSSKCWRGSSELSVLYDVVEGEVLLVWDGL